MIAYYRVSTKKQNDSGNGLDAQRHDVADHVERSGCDLIAEYTEVETGKKHDLDNRPQLQRALSHAKRSKATLVISKLDRLLRSTVVRALLKTSSVPFICCDQPNANELTIDILAAVAEDEVRTISKRTRAGLAAKKARGGVQGLLGGARPGHPKPTRTMALLGAAASAKVRSAAAATAYDDLLETMRSLRAEGQSLRKIATFLNDSGQMTRNQKPWNPVQVGRVLSRPT